MRIPNRHSKVSAPHHSGRHIEVTPPQSKVDVWISRFASLSQVGLFALTIGGLYFTVLPLYQKALLEEAIAKKEVELRNISASLEESYLRVRDSAVNKFVLGVGLSCSGLFLPPANAELIGIRIPNRKPFAQEILEIEPQKCLVNILPKYTELSALRPDDMIILQDAVNRIAIELNKKRSTLIADSSSSWNSSKARNNAIAYGEFVRSHVLELRSIQWKK